MRDIELIEKVPCIAGFALQGATWSTDSGVETNDGSSFAIPSAVIRWKPSQQQAGQGDQGKRFSCPVYLNAERDTLLFDAELQTLESRDTLIQRGVCLTVGGGGR